jgi:hypothetical protein
MIFLKIFLAWTLFCWGAMIFVSEAHEYVTKEKNTLADGDYQLIFRWFLMSGCLSVWYWLLFA